MQSLVGQPPGLILPHGPSKLLVDEYLWHIPNIGIVAAYTPKEQDVRDHFGVFRAVDQVESFGQATAISCSAFLDTNKYPPSLLYMCMTIGPSVLFLALTEHAKGKVVEIISVYGRVAFFYYLAHFLLIHIVSTFCFFLLGHSAADGQSDPMMPFFLVAGEGFSLGIVYLFWAAVVISLYPVCRWYDSYKRANRDKWWLSYL